MIVAAINDKTLREALANYLNNHQSEVTEEAKGKLLKKEEIDYSIRTFKGGQEITVYIRGDK